MSHEKKTGSEPFTGKPEDAAHLVQAVESSEVQRRINSLADSVGKLENHLLERHARLITWIFSGVALIVGLASLSVAILSASSRFESREASKEMKQEVKDKLDEMEKRFQTLAGDSLKKPLLQISCKNGPLDGQRFELRPGADFPLYPLFLRNDGDRRTEPLSIRLYSTTLISLNGDINWQQVESNDKDYPFSYYFLVDSRTMGIGIAPKETWTLEKQFAPAIYPSTTNAIVCRLLIFYGADKPAEAKFLIQFKQ
jgi:hypothetical protein